jgi:hypothetical protein
MRSPEASGLAEQVIFKRLRREGIWRGSGKDVASRDLKRPSLKRPSLVLKGSGFSRAENTSELTAALAAEVEGGRARKGSGFIFAPVDARGTTG